MSLMEPLRLSRMLLVAALAAAPVANAQTVDVDLGGMALSVSSSSTAQVFHIVDQLSEWDQSAHKAYGRWAAKTLNLTDEDKRLLQQHAELRRARGWGKGFEQSHAEAIRAAAASAGLSFQALNEGIAYALAPGLTDDNKQVDYLAETLVRTVIRGTPSSDAYVQSAMVASVIRPLLRASLDQGETFSAFLPKAANRWRTISPR